MREDHELHGEADLGDVRVVAVDSRGERRQVMRRLLEHSFQPEEIAEADSRPAAIELVGRCRPDVVVLEIQMPFEVGSESDLRDALVWFEKAFQSAKPPRK